MSMAMHWIAKSISKKNKGKFSGKAKRAGMTTREYAKKEYHAPGALGKEAREATTLMRMH